MPTPTYTPLANITLTGSAASVTFSSISGLYRDIIVVCRVLAASTSVASGFIINSDTGSNYNYVVMRGNGSTATSASGTNALGTITYSGSATTTDPDAFIVQFLDYSATDKHKSVIARSDNSGATNAAVTLWASTSAITSIQIKTTGGASYAAGSSFALYGVAA